MKRVLLILAAIVWVVAATVSVLWIREAMTCGFCEISRHYAPISFIGTPVALLLTIWAKRVGSRSAKSR
jgi:hypothetical protein